MIFTRLNSPQNLLAKEALFVSVTRPPTERPMLSDISGPKVRQAFVTLRAGRRRPAFGHWGRRRRDRS